MRCKFGHDHSTQPVKATRYRRDGSWVVPLGCQKPDCATAEAQKLIAATLSARFLQFKAFDSPNAKFIYVPTGKEGLPIIVSPEVK